MSRIGKKPIAIPKGVEIKVDKNVVSVKGPKGSLHKTFSTDVDISTQEGAISVSSMGSDKHFRALHGLTRTLISNMIEGANNGYEKVLEISGVGYKSALQGRNVVLNLGFSHQITFPLPDGIDAAIEKQTVITLKGADKELLGQVAANIRGMRIPEPYKGKGIKYKNERIIRKAGKTGKK
uniref:Large ribosomal subunit protein uL6 n=2 Tax=environmental samples TaxID=67798 RepID=A0A0H4T6R1_9BACT|nr:50S ribosomal protein L6, large subunit ribosomal protein L6 [uncultured Nitrospirae bacterium Rifle_16ft_4_minimus_38035]AKQ05299.1 50S ribosomal protein L6, large subunit ribosomal protein L6 [uncultured Nitrospirae bacterium Rifle_16ft_4_minimus_24026]